MMAGNFSTWVSSLERRMREKALFYTKTVGKHNFQKR